MVRRPMVGTFTLFFSLPPKVMLVGGFCKSVLVSGMCEGMLAICSHRRQIEELLRQNRIREKIFCVHTSNRVTVAGVGEFLEGTAV